MMARRKKSLLSVLLSPPKRRPARRAMAPTRSVAAKSVKTATTAIAKAIAPTLPKAPKTRPKAKKPVAATRPGGLGSWIESHYVGPAGSRGYFLYVPKGLPRTQVPLLVLLHGCSQTPAEFAAATRFNQQADRQGFVVVYPHQTMAHNLNRCWNWFETRNQSRLVGEPAIIAGIVAQVAAAPSRRIDRSRIYVAGLSAGASMALTLGATYPDVFAGIGVHSGPPYRSATGGAQALAAMGGRTQVPAVSETAYLAPGIGIPPTIVFQGTADFTVRAVNGSRVTDEWLAYRAAAVSGPADPERVTRSRVTPNATGRRNSQVTRWYTARGRTCLESWLVTGLGHAWSGGLAKGSFSDPLGPRATTVMWRFLAAQRLG
jgi:poly(hydroxyalkanoate) depolymerase family esterase